MDSGAKIVIQKMPFAVKILDETAGLFFRTMQNADKLLTKRPRNPHDEAPQIEVETYYGFGEKRFIEMSRHGKTSSIEHGTFISIGQTDYQSIPFFYALHRRRNLRFILQ